MNTHSFSKSFDTINCEEIFIRNSEDHMMTLSEYVTHQTLKNIQTDIKPEPVISQSSETIPGIENPNQIGNPQLICISYISQNPNALYRILVTVSGVEHGIAQHFSTEETNHGGGSSTYEQKYYIYAEPNTDVSDIKAFLI